MLKAKHSCESRAHLAQSHLLPWKWQYFHCYQNNELLSKHFSLFSNLPCVAILKCVAFILQVLVASVEPKRPAHLLLSVDHSTSFNAVARSMVALMTVLLWQATLVAPVVFPRVLSFLLEVTLANPEKTWWKAGKCSAHYSHLVVVQSFDVAMHSC